MSCNKLETKQYDGYRREKYQLQVEPGVWMPFYKLIPDVDPLAKYNVAIALHGHGAFAKEGVQGALDEDMLDRVG